MAGERVDIVVAESGAKPVADNIKAVGTAAETSAAQVDKTNASLNMLKTASGATTTPLLSMAGAANASFTPLQRVAAAAVTFGPALKGVSTFATDAASPLREFSTAVATAAPALVNAGAAATAAVSPLQAAASSATSLSSAFNLIKVAVAGLAIGEAVNQYKTLSDTFTGIINRLKLVSTSGKDLAATEQKLYESANRTRGSFEASANLYTKLAMQAGQLGIEQKSLIPTIETINQLVAISGTTAQEAEAGLLQFSQGLASNKFAGDELRSVLENIPALGQAIAKGLGVTTAGLRDMGANGQLTAKLILDAISKSAPEIQRQFASIVPTIGGAIQVLKNNMLQMVGTFDQLNNGGSRVAAFILVLADNIGTLARAVGVAAATVASFYIGLAVQAGWAAFSAAMAAATTGTVMFRGAILATTASTSLFSQAISVMMVPVQLLTGGITVLWAAVRAHPFAALLTVIGLVASALYFFGQSVKLNSDGSITALGAVVGIANLLWQGLVKLGGYVSAVLGPVFSYLGSLITTVFSGALAVMDKILGFLGRFIPSMKAAQGDLAGFGATVIQAMKDGTASMQPATLATKDFGDQFQKTGDQVGGASAGIVGSMKAIEVGGTQMGRVVEASLPVFENLVKAADKAAKAMENAKTSMERYAKTIEWLSAKNADLSVTTRDAMGNIITYVNEAANQTASQYNKMSSAIDGVTASYNDMTSAAAASAAAASAASSPITSSRSMDFGWGADQVNSNGGAKPQTQGWQDTTGLTAWGAQFLQGNNGGQQRTLQQFASGGSFDVGGSGGTDSQLVQFMASPSERVNVETPAQQAERERAKNAKGRDGKSIVVNMTVQTPDAGGFRRSQNQMLLDLRSKLNGV